jgi:hypothetical protein
MKRQFLITILLIILSLQISAQKTKDALYLKNGSIIYGKLLEIEENQYKMQTSDGSILIYPFSDVDKYVQETPVFTGRKTTGPGFALEGGFLLGAQITEYVAPFSFNLMGSYTFNTKNIVSLGSGVEFIGVPFTPMFVEYKYILRDNRTTPFFFLRGGGLLHLSGNDGDANPYNSYEKDFEPYLSFAYRYCRTSYALGTYINGNYDYDYHYENNYNRLEIKFGFRF